MWHVSISYGVAAHESVKQLKFYRAKSPGHSIPREADHSSAKPQLAKHLGAVSFAPLPFSP